MLSSLSMEQQPLPRGPAWQLLLDREGFGITYDEDDDAPAVPLDDLFSRTVAMRESGELIF